MDVKNVGCLLILSLPPLLSVARIESSLVWIETRRGCGGLVQWVGGATAAAAASRSTALLNKFFVFIKIIMSDAPRGARGAAEGQ